MATNIKTHSKYYTGNGVPKAGDPFGSLPQYAHYYDRDAKLFYIHMGSNRWILDPEYQFTQSTTPPPTQPPTTSVGMITLMPSGGDDSIQWQNAINTSYSTGQGIFAYGSFRFAKGVKIAKDHKFLNVIGWFEIIPTANDITLFYSDIPTDTAEAESIYTTRKLSFSNFVLRGNGTQTGFDLFATEGTKYDHVWGYDLKRHIDVTFGLRTEINSCEATNCIDGIIVRSGVGRWANATTSNSCSNGTRLISPRVYGHQSLSQTGIGIYDASNVEVINPVIEGFKFNVAGIDWQSMSPTSTGAYIFKPHFECANTCTAVKLRSSTMTHVIEAPNFIKPGTHIHISVGGGYPQINVKDSSNQKIFFDGTTPVFKHEPGASWKFTNCDNPINSVDLPKMFSGTISQGCGVGAGANKFCIENPPNR